VRWRLLPLAVVAAVLAADALALHRIAGHVLLAAVVAAAVAAVALVGDLVEVAAAARSRRSARVDVLLAAAGLVCVLIAAVARGHAADGAAVADAAFPGLLAALVVYGTLAVTSLVLPQPRPG
jgi:hypothetical protein